MDRDFGGGFLPFSHRTSLWHIPLTLQTGVDFAWRQDDRSRYDEPAPGFNMYGGIKLEWLPAGK